MDPARAHRRMLLAQHAASVGNSPEMPARRRAVAALAAGATMAGAPATANALRYYAPAPPQYSVVYDSPKDAGGLDPATGQPYPAVGQYADINTNTVHTTPGFSKRQIAQDVGQIVGYNVLAPGDRNYFSRLLGTDPARWSNVHGSEARGGGNATGDEAFADYYALAATGGLQKGESMAWGDISIDPAKLRKFTAAVQRLGKRHGLKRYKP